MFKKLLKLLLGAGGAFTCVLLIYMISGNLIATNLEKEIDEDKVQFRKLFPTTEANNSALKLEELTSKLGIAVYSAIRERPIRTFHHSLNSAKQKEFKDINQELGKYLDTQLEKPNNNIDIPSDKLLRYLSDNQAILEEIENYILTNEMPKWEVLNLSSYSWDEPLPSKLNFVYLQNILLLNILEKTRLGQHKAALKTLEVSWKLNQSLLGENLLISQLVYIIVARRQAPIIRKMSSLTPEWKILMERFNNYYYSQAFITSLDSEKLWLTNLILKIKSNEIVDAFTGINEGSKFINFQGFNLVYRPYLRLATIDNWNRISRLNRELSQQYTCDFNPDELEKKPELARAWWNILDGSVVGQWRKVIKMAIHLELTQKVIKIKELAAKEGNWPKQFTQTQSSICNGAQWVYHVDKNGVMSIYLNKEYEWLKKQPQEKGYIPFSYSEKYQASN